MDNQALISAERIERAIFLIRGQKVMLDVDLAALYGVDPGGLNRAVKRNRDRVLRISCSSSRPRRRKT